MERFDTADLLKAREPSHGLDASKKTKIQVWISGILGIASLSFIRFDLLDQLLRCGMPLGPVARSASWRRPGRWYRCGNRIVAVRFAHWCS